MAVVTKTSRIGFRIFSISLRIMLKRKKSFKRKRVNKPLGQLEDVKGALAQAERNAVMAQMKAKFPSGPKVFF